MSDSKKDGKEAQAARSSIKNDLKRRHRYVTSFVLSCGFLNHDERQMMYWEMMRSLDWAYGKLHKDTAEQQKDEAEDKEVIYV